MARSESLRRPRARRRPPSLTGLLLFTIVFETLIAVWSFTHFGAGASSIAVRRFPEWGAEGLVAIAAITAACAYLTLEWKRWGAWGVLGGLAAQMVWFFVRPPLSEGLPGGLYSTVFVLTLGSAIGLAMTLPRVWGELERG